MKTIEMRHLEMASWKRMILVLPEQTYKVWVENFDLSDPNNVTFTYQHLKEFASKEEAMTYFESLT